MIVFIATKEEGDRYEGGTSEIFGVFHARSQAIDACREDCGEVGAEDKDDWVHSVEDEFFPDRYTLYRVTRHEVPKLKTRKRS